MSSQNLKSDKTIGENIRRLRKKKGITQEAFTAQLQLKGIDLSRGTFAKIEAGIRHISADELRAIRAILNVDYTELIGE